MQEKNASNFETEDQFLTLLKLASENDAYAISLLLSFFEKDMEELSSYVTEDKEDFIQSMRLFLIEKFKKGEIQVNLVEEEQ